MMPSLSLDQQQIKDLKAVLLRNQPPGTAARLPRRLACLIGCTDMAARDILHGRKVSAFTLDKVLIVLEKAGVPCS